MRVMCDKGTCTRHKWKFTRVKSFFVMINFVVVCYVSEILLKDSQKVLGSPTRLGLEPFEVEVNLCVLTSY